MKPTEKAILFLDKSATKEVMHPGIKGGKGYWDEKGKWQYGEKPQSKPSAQPEPPAFEDVGLPAIDTKWLKKDTGETYIVADNHGQTVTLRDASGNLATIIALQKWRSLVSSGEFSADIPIYKAPSVGSEWIDTAHNSTFRVFGIQGDYGVWVLYSGDKESVPVTEKQWSEWTSSGVFVPKNPERTEDAVRAGNVYFYNGRFYMVTTVNEKTGVVSYESDYQDSFRDGEFSSVMTSPGHTLLSVIKQGVLTKEWRAVRRVNLPEVKELEYRPGDLVSLRRGGTFYDFRVFHANDERVFLVRGDRDGQDDFHSVARDELDRMAVDGRAKVSLAPADVPLDGDVLRSVMATPVDDSLRQHYSIPSRGQRYFMDQQGRERFVKDVDDETITFGEVYPSMFSSDSQDITVAVKDWGAEAEKLFGKSSLRQLALPAKFFVPPSAYPGKSTEAKAIAAKAMVCDRLYRRLIQDKDFVSFALTETPNLTPADRNDAGLPSSQPADESEVVRQQARVYLTVRKLVHLWAISSADTQSKAQCMQRAVRDEFALQDCWDSMSSAEPTRIYTTNEEEGRKAFSLLVDTDYARFGLAYRKFVRAQYEETQEFLKSKGIKALKVYRGMSDESGMVKFSPGEEEKPIYYYPLILQPQSAFSTHPAKAFDFATIYSSGGRGVVFATEVPASRIISTALTGVGCLDEHEVTILGGSTVTAVAYQADQWEDRKEKVGRADNKLWKSQHVTGKRAAIPVDKVVANADWTKRTADIPRHELMRTLRYFGISHKEFSRLPAAAAYRHMRPRSTRKSHEALTYWLQKSRKGHDVSQEARNERGEWATSASMATPPTGARAVDDVAENPRIGDNIETANGTRYNVIGFGKDDHRRRGVKLYVLPSPDAPSVFSKPMVMTISIEAWREDCREEGSTVTPVQGDAPSFKDKPPKPPKPAPTIPPAPKTIAPGASLPESTARPGSTPVSAAISLPKSAGSDSLKVALAAIDRVHGDGVLPTLPVLITSAKSREGAYTYNPSTGKPGKIMVSRTADNLAYTFVHEIGHFLDQQALGKGKFASDSSSEVVPGMNKWYDAVKNSEAYKGLKALSYRIGIDVVGPDGKKQWYKLDSRYIRYLCLPSEAFARSYSQYVAMKSGDPELLAGLEEDRKDKGALHYSVQWQDEDFKPIADALDELFRGLGWMK